MEGAEEKFKEVQNAYEILIDPRERSWYDSHRSSILRSSNRYQAGSSQHYGRGEPPEDFVNVFSYFTSTCFSGFHDGHRGFYSVYCAVFDQLKNQEVKARPKSEYRYPTFGSSTSPWSDVKHFYAEWGSFVTHMDFAWVQEYNPATAGNRKVRRLMEQENEKSRKAARKEYNENIKTLVQFVKKRDKRVIAQQAHEAQEKIEREKTEREAKKKKEEARQALRQQLRESEGWEEEDEQDEEEPLPIWFCPACDKYFKSEGALNNHEKSKKHKEAIEILRMKLTSDMTSEEEDFDQHGRIHDVEDKSNERVDINPSFNTFTTGVDDDYTSESSSMRSTSSENQDVIRESGAEGCSAGSLSESKEPSSSEDEPLDEEDMLLSLLQNTKLRQESEFVSRSSIEEEAKGSMTNNASSEGHNSGIHELKDKDATHAQAEVSTRRRRRRAKPVRKQISNVNPEKQCSEHTCNVCKAIFFSRNQLFKHVKSSGHALAL